MNVNTGEIISFGDDTEAEKFFKMVENRADFIPLKDKHITKDELDNKKVVSDEIKDCLIAINDNKDAPRGVRRRLEKKLYKLRKKATV